MQTWTQHTHEDTHLGSAFEAHPCIFRAFDSLLFQLYQDVPSQRCHTGSRLSFCKSVQTNNCSCSFIWKIIYSPNFLSKDLWQASSMYVKLECVWRFSKKSGIMLQKCAELPHWLSSSKCIHHNGFLESGSTWASNLHGAWPVTTFLGAVTALGPTGGFPDQSRMTVVASRLFSYDV